MKKVNSIKAIYREADGYPVVVTISSLADVYKILGYAELMTTKIDDDVLVFSRATAYEDGEPLCLTDTIEEDGVIRTKYIYGDVIIVGYDPELEDVTSLSQYQLSRLLFVPESLE